MGDMLEEPERQIAEVEERVDFTERMFGSERPRRELPRPDR